MSGPRLQESQAKVVDDIVGSSQANAEESRLMEDVKPDDRHGEDLSERRHEMEADNDVLFRNRTGLRNVTVKLPTSPPEIREFDSSHNSPGSILNFSSSSDPSSDFETDSTCSGEETEVEIDELLSLPTASNILDIITEEFQAEMIERKKRLLDPVLTPMKRGLVDRIMNDFWLILNQEWTAGVRTCTNGSSSSYSAPAFQSNASRGSSNTRKHKVSKEDDDDGDTGENEDRDSNRAPNGSSPIDTLGTIQNFACPYRKHNAQKYNPCNRRWRTCSLTSFNTVARLKYFLYPAIKSPG
jgi:hypothetical protein